MRLFKQYFFQIIISYFDVSLAIQIEMTFFKMKLFLYVFKKI